jgi:hypothetical protein
MPLDGRRIYPPAEGLRGHRVYDYRSAYEVELQRDPPPWKRFPSVMASWDNSARRPSGARMYAGATPAAYERWLRRAVASVDGVRAEENLLFLLAWNEWAEGNHLEPDHRYGRAYLEATRAVLAPPGPDGGGPTRGGLVATLDPVPAQAPTGGDRDGRLRAAAAAVSLTVDLVGTPGRIVADLLPFDEAVGRQVRAAGLGYVPLLPTGSEDDGGDHGGPSPGPRWMAAGQPIERPDVLDGLLARLDTVDDVAALLLLDGLHRLARPTVVLSALSRWALGAGAPLLVVAVPNATHLDRGMGALLGTTGPGGPDGACPPGGGRSACRPFTLSSFEDAAAAGGWRDVGTADSESIRPASASGTTDAVPDVLAAAARALARTVNPAGTVDWIVRALTPLPPGVDHRADGWDVGPPGERSPDHGPLTRGQRRELDGYLTAVGTVVSERNRRAGGRMAPE